MADRLYRTCDTCGITKYFTKFQTIGKQKNKQRSVERRRKPYCKECRRKGWHNKIKREAKQTPSPSLFTIEDLSDERYGFIIYSSRARKWRSKIDLEKAKQLVENGKARVRNSYMIVKLEYTNQEIRNLILERDDYTCAICNGRANIAVKIDKDGPKIPENMHAVCFSCHGILPPDPYKKWNKNPVHFAIPIYLNDKIITAIHNPPDQMLNVLRDMKTKIYCDASEYQGQGLYGIAVVVVGGKRTGIRIYTSTFNYQGAQIHYAELQAVQFALTIINDIHADCSTSSIYTDVNFYEYINPQNHMRQAVENINKRKGDVGIFYLNNEQQKNPFYRMAHRYARKAIESYLEFGE